ncbi:NUDIX domain-containing protein [Halobacterium jilantaiense]|uniref:8-oxo-dGTP diphosphatase n=1 Tax=Halobacterium jilantaiense TaxID=355548 RepID=A0A1I0QCW4_9EURY|nr:NUDIX domain-containing protein [Halobacterium jilantaiense]SEW24826.1 8-oxo-dGTP diphosphatase [Halobacterium jilantaiense]
MDDYALVVNVDAAVVRGDDYLVVRRSAAEDHAAGTLAFPGGKVEPDASGDAIWETARREVREEVGVEVSAVEYVTSSTFTADEGTECLNVVVRCEYESGEPEVREPEEVADAFWLGYDDLVGHEDVPEYVEVYADAVEESR